MSDIIDDWLYGPNHQEHLRKETRQKQGRGNRYTKRDLEIINAMVISGYPMHDIAERYKTDVNSMRATCNYHGFRRRRFKKAGQ